MPVGAALPCGAVLSIVRVILRPCKHARKPGLEYRAQVARKLPVGSVQE